MKMTFIIYMIFTIINFATAVYYHIKYYDSQHVEHKEIVSMLKAIFWCLMIIVLNTILQIFN